MTGVVMRRSIMQIIMDNDKKTKKYRCCTRKARTFPCICVGCHIVRKFAADEFIQSDESMRTEYHSLHFYWLLHEVRIQREADLANSSTRNVKMLSHLVLPSINLNKTPSSPFLHLLENTLGGQISQYLVMQLGDTSSTNLVFVALIKRAVIWNVLTNTEQTYPSVIFERKMLKRVNRSQAWNATKIVLHLFYIFLI